MRSNLKRLLLVALVATLFVGALGGVAAAYPDLPENGSIYLYYTGDHWNERSYFPIVRIGDAGPLTGEYLGGWCANWGPAISWRTLYPTAHFYSSYEPLPPGLVDRPENLDLVNWIMNAGLVYSPAIDEQGVNLGNFTKWDIQMAIWRLIDHTWPAWVTGPIGDSGSYSEERVQLAVRMASAHEGFVPGCGQYLGVIAAPYSGATQVQPVIFPFPIECGRVVVEKVVPEGSPAASFGFSSSWAGGFSLAGGGAHASGPLMPGVYSVTELAPLPAGWSLESAVCDDGSEPVAIGVSPGETVTCRFTNTFGETEGPSASLTVVKATDPAGGSGFSFDGDLGAFLLDDGGSVTFDELAAGSYVVSEAVADPWVLESIDCGEAAAVVEGSSVTVTLAEGEAAVCTFTNSRTETAGPDGSLTIVKRTVPAGGSGFVFTGSEGLGAPFSLDDGASRVFTELAAGAYTVTESPSTDWEFASVECEAADWSADGATVTVNLGDGEVAVCTFTNGELPYTGSGLLLPALAGGLSLLLAGAVMLLRARAGVKV